MEAILNLGKNVVSNYSYLKKLVISVFLAAITATGIMSIHMQSEYKLSQSIIASNQVVKLVENNVVGIEHMIIITEDKENTINTVEAKVNQKTPLSKSNDTTVTAEQSTSLTNEVSVTFYGNGGIPEVVTETFDIDMFDISNVKQPERMGKIFTGWFEDSACTIPFDGNVESGELSIYAGWSEIPGYLCNDKGYIYGTNGLNLQDGLAILPNEKSCIGVEANMFSGVEEDVFEIYIPANIIHINTDAFESLPYLIYIQVEEGNPSYYSNDGILYHSNGNVAFIPRMRR